MSSRRGANIEATYLVLLAALFSVPVARVLLWFYNALPYPYDLDYNEGIVWKQMLEIIAGRGYAPIDRFPAIVFHYPPVYYWATAAFAQTGLDQLFAGRLVSLVATVGSTLIVGDLARRLTQPQRPFGAGVAMVAAMVIFLLFRAIHTWAPQMRVDAISCFFALAGLWCVTLSDRRPALIYLAAVCFVLSVFSKQVSVVTAAASFGALILLRPRLAVRAIAATVMLGLVVLAGLIWQTDGGVISHLFLYNINRFELGRLLPNLYQSTKTDLPFLLLGAAGYLLVLVDAWRRRQKMSELSLTRVSMLLFLPIATLSLITSAKYGSSSSYYVQWEAALAIFGAVAFVIVINKAAQQLANGSAARAAGWAAIPVALAVWALSFPAGRSASQLDAARADDLAIVRLLEPVKGEIVSDQMAILMRMRRDVVWEPAIFAELARADRWDENLIVERIRDGRIGAVVSRGNRGSKMFEERYNPAVADAIDAALPREVKVGIYVVHLPAAATASDGNRRP